MPMMFGWGACTGIKKMLLLMAENLFLEPIGVFNNSKTNQFLRTITNRF